MLNTLGDSNIPQIGTVIHTFNSSQNIFIAQVDVTPELISTLADAVQKEEAVKLMTLGGFVLYEVKKFLRINGTRFSVTLQRKS